jgi:hypothetical protein
MAIVAVPCRHAYAWSQKGRLSSWPRGVDDESRAARPPGGGGAADGTDQHPLIKNLHAHRKNPGFTGGPRSVPCILQLQRDLSLSFASGPSAWAWAGRILHAGLLVRSVFPPLLQPDRVHQCRDRCPCMHGRHLF